MPSKLAPVAVGAVVFIGIIALFSLLFPVMFLAAVHDFETATGIASSKPAPPPPVEVVAGQEFYVDNMSYAKYVEFPIYANPPGGIAIFPNEPSPVPLRYLTIYQIGPHTVYALNVTNNTNEPIVLVALTSTVSGIPEWLIGLPIGTPWYTNETPVNKGGVLFVNDEFYNATILPHSSMVLYNASQLDNNFEVFFKFANGSWYMTPLKNVPIFSPTV